MPNRADVAIVGAGILGLAHAYVFARKAQARGSVRQTSAGQRRIRAQFRDDLADRAARGRDAPDGFAEPGSVAGSADGVAIELPGGGIAAWWRTMRTKRKCCASSPRLDRRPVTLCRWLKADEVRERSPAVQEENLQGALWSDLEFTVDPREAVVRLREYLQESGVECRSGAAVTRIELPAVETASERWDAGSAVVCAGDDFETLYPQAFAESGVTRCKLQMMRTMPQPGGWHS